MAFFKYFYCWKRITLGLENLDKNRFCLISINFCCLIAIGLGHCRNLCLFDMVGAVCPKEKKNKNFRTSFPLVNLFVMDLFAVMVIVNYCFHSFTSFQIGPCDTSWHHSNSIHLQVTHQSLEFGSCSSFC